MKTDAETIKVKLQKSRKILNEVEILMSNSFYETLVNRLYYASFHAASAALLTKNVKPYTHKGVQQMFGLHFVKTKIVPPEMGRIFSESFFMRQYIDYDDYADIGNEKAEELFKQVTEFVNNLENIILDK